MKRLLGNGAKYGCLGRLWHSLREEQRTTLRGRGGRESGGFSYHPFILKRAHFSSLPYPHPHPRPHPSFLPSFIIHLPLHKSSFMRVSLSEFHSHTVLPFPLVIHGIVPMNPKNRYKPGRFCDEVPPHFQTRLLFLPPPNTRTLCLLIDKLSTGVTLLTWSAV